MFILVIVPAAGVAVTSWRSTAVASRAAFVATESTIGAALRGGADPQQVLASAPVASAKLYRAGGEMVARASRNEPASNAIVRWLTPAEVDCQTLDGGLTLCLEPSTAAMTAAVTRGLTALVIAAGAALLLGAIAGYLLGKRMAVQRLEIAALTASGSELRAQMQQREIVLRRRSVELEAANRELESFAYTVSHDLRGPLGGVEGFAQALESDLADDVTPETLEYVGWIREGCRQMRELIEGLLQMSRLARSELRFDDVDLTAIAHTVAESLRHAAPERPARFLIGDGLRTSGDERLLRAVVENLMTNAWKFTRTRPETVIEVGRAGEDSFFVRDNGVGFDPSYAAKMFRPFQRLHASNEFEGTGIGLATVQKILERHGGKVWAEGEPDRGATIYFTTGADPIA